MNPISQLLKLPAEATVGDARKLVAEQVMKSMTSQPGRESLLSALECGPYERKFGKKRGKTLTLLNEQLPLDQHHGMILQEANRELATQVHELVQDELEARPRYRVEGERAVLVTFETPESLPSGWRPDILDAFRTPESALKKQLRELIQAGNYLSHDQLSQAQVASLSQPATTPEDDTDTEEDED